MKNALYKIVIVAILLSGCSWRTPVEHAFDDVQQAVKTVKTSLPKECQTKEILARIDTLEAKKEVAQSVCEEKIKSIENKYERTLFALILVVSILFLRFFLKR